MKQLNNKGFSIVVALGLSIIMVLLVLYILEYMIPYSRNVKGIENSTNAFYQAESGIEDGLYFFKTRSELRAEKNINLLLSKSVDFGYSTVSSGSVIPESEFGNSDFDSNFNTLSVGNPIQLQIGKNSVPNWNTTLFRFKAPDLSGNTSIDEVVVGGTDIIINWQLSSSNNSLNASGSYIQAGNICSGNTDIVTCSDLVMEGREGLDLNGDSSDDFDDYYAANCNGVLEECTLKLSVINKLEIQNNTPLPYLEYNIDFASANVPLRFSRIESEGKSYGFQKKLKVRVPQQTTNEAFDFTVFQ